MGSTTTDDDQRTRAAIARITRHLVAHGRADVDVDDIDVDLALVMTAASVHGLLGVLQRSFATGGEHPRVIAGIVDLATSYRICSTEVLGVCGALVGRVRDADEASIGHLLAAAHHRTRDRELVAGVAALFAATICYVADAFAVPPITVHDEIHRDPTAASVRLRRYCRDHD